MVRLALIALLVGSGCGKIVEGTPDGATDAVGGIDGAGTCAPTCNVNATCTGETCACNDGFMGDGLTCADIDECATNNGGCDVNAACVNASGSRMCNCKLGYVGDGVTCRQSWQRIGTFPNVVLDQGNNRGFDAVGLSSSIYFAPKYDDPAVGTQMRAINVATGVISGNLALPPAPNDFFAGGFGEVFVADGSALYLFGDDGYRYNPGGNTWTAVPGYTNGSGFRRGEAAGAFAAGSNSIILVGGRDEATNSYQATAVRYTIGVVSGNPWKAEPGALAYTTSRGGAYTLEGTTDTYVAGGYPDDSNRRHLAVHTITQTAWTTLADAPGDIGDVLGMGEFTTGGVPRLIVASGTKAYFYEPVSNTWDRTISLPTSTLSRLVMVGGAPYVIAQNGTSAEVYKLTAIE